MDSKQRENSEVSTTGSTIIEVLLRKENIETTKED